MTSIGFYVGGDMTDLATAQAWLGRSVDMVSASTGRAGWDDWRNSVGWQIQNLKGVAAAPLWTIPLFADQGTLHAAAAGTYNADYVAFARQLIAAYGTGMPIVVRTGEEFNGTWMPWSAAAAPGDYIKAYQNFVDAFRSVAGNFKFEWNVNIGGQMDPATAYPGDKYVDYVGMDFYWDSQQAWSTIDPVAAFSYFRDEPHGLQWLESFAAAHGKQTAYSEWGANSSDAAPFFQLVKQWFDSHNVAYQLYWDSDAAFAGKLDNGRYGPAGDAFRQLFGVTQADAPHMFDGAAIIGDGSAARLVGTAVGEQITAYGPFCDIAGRGGADSIVAADGNHHIYGNDSGTVAGALDGADTIVAGSGTNYINGNAGNDVVTVGTYGSLGTNRVLGGQGDDLITVRGAGANRINGNNGNDVIHAEGATGENVLRGGQGDDAIYAGHGVDQLWGDLGNDVLHAGVGIGHVTVMAGGAGSDLFDFSAAGSATPAAVGGVVCYQEVTDFSISDDRLELRFHVSLGHLLGQGTPALPTAADAQTYAAGLLASHDGADYVVVTQVGADAFLFFADSAAGNLGVVKLDGLGGAVLSTGSFN